MNNKILMGIALMLFITSLITLVILGAEETSVQPDTPDTIEVSSNEQEVEDDGVPPKKEIGFDIDQVGKPYPELEEDLLNILKGDKDGSIFSKDTAGKLNGVSIKEDGTVIVDFIDFRNDILSPTTAEKGKLGRELLSSVFQHQKVTKVYFQFNGSASAWWSWLEAYPEPLTRKNWKGK